MEFPEDGGAGIAGARNRPTNKLLDIDCVEGILENLKSHGWIGQHTCTWQKGKVMAKGLQVFGKNTKTSPRKHLKTQAIDCGEKTPKQQKMFKPQAQ